MNADFWLTDDTPTSLIDENEYELMERFYLHELRLVMENSTVFERYTETMMITLRLALQSGYYVDRFRTTFEILMSTFIMFAGLIYFAYMFIIALNVIFAAESSSNKYDEIRREIRAYCRAHRLSAELTERIFKHIEIKYQKHYFNEPQILQTVPSNLRTEIMLHTCSHLVSKVPLFKELPQSILKQIVGCLKLEVFFPGDIIIQMGEVGDCMFFISSGAADIIADTGDVMNRLTDGSHFGEISLLSRGNRRMATVKAVEVCEAYKLSRRDFRKVIEPHHDLLRYLEHIALQRIRAASTFQRVTTKP